MTKKLTLNAQARTITGRKVKQLRQSGLIPANIFGKKIKSTAISLDSKEFSTVYEQAGETQLIDLILEKKTNPVLISEIQIHPVTNDILHIDLHQVDLKEKVTATIPLVFINESPAEKQALGTVVKEVQEIEVTALPSDLPEHIDVDLSTLSEVDQSIHLKDLQFDRSKIETDQDPELILVKVEPPQKEEVIVAPVSTEAVSTEETKEAPTEEAVPPKEESSAKE